MWKSAIANDASSSGAELNPPASAALSATDEGRAEIEGVPLSEALKIANGSTVSLALPDLHRKRLANPSNTPREGAGEL